MSETDNTHINETDSPTPSRGKERLSSASPLSHQISALGTGHISPENMERACHIISTITHTFHQRIVGQTDLCESLLICLLAEGHILLESVPGLAKTTAAHTLARSVQASFHRIQCTPDLMPNDIVGTQIYNMHTGEMTTQLGPVHANFVLLDEINRSSAKTQSAMLEAMQERQTSIGGVMYPVPQPFMVMATQNPIEEEGTYVLPEAQMDRFLLKEVVTYPSPVDELEIVNNTLSGNYAEEKVQPVAQLSDITFLQQQRKNIYIHPAIRTYIVDLVNTTRGAGPSPLPQWSSHVRLGGSPRASLALSLIHI